MNKPGFEVEDLKGGVAGGFGTRKLWVDKIAGGFPIHLSETLLSRAKISPQSSYDTLKI